MRDRPLLYLCLVIAAAVILSVLLGGERFIRELRPSALEKNISEGESVIVRGQVYRIEQKENYQVLYLEENEVRYKRRKDQKQSVQKESVQKKLIQKQSDQERTLQESRVIVYTDSDIQFQIGNKIELAGEVSFFQGARNPGNFDQKRFYQIQDIHGRVWAEEIHVAEACIWKWRAYFADLRRRWKDALTVHMGEEDGAVMSAMILGEKSGMDQEVKALYQVNGIGHILAKKCTNGCLCV